MFSYIPILYFCKYDSDNSWNIASCPNNIGNKTNKRNALANRIVIHEISALFFWNVSTMFQSLQTNSFITYTTTRNRQKGWLCCLATVFAIERRSWHVICFFFFVVFRYFFLSWLISSEKENPLPNELGGGQTNGKLENTNERNKEIQLMSEPDWMPNSPALVQIRVSLLNFENPLISIFLRFVFQGKRLLEGRVLCLVRWEKHVFMRRYFSFVYFSKE